MRSIMLRAFIRKKLGLRVQAKDEELKQLYDYPWLILLTPLFVSIGGIEFSDFSGDFMLEGSCGVVFLLDQEGRALSSSRGFKVICMYQQIMRALDKVAFGENKVRFIVLRKKIKRSCFFKIYTVQKQSLATQQMCERYRKVWQSRPTQSSIDAAL